MPDFLPNEIAARAIARNATINYPDTPKGRAAAQAYVDEHWRAIWETLPRALAS